MNRYTSLRLSFVILLFVGNVNIAYGNEEGVPQLKNSEAEESNKKKSEQERNREILIKSNQCPKCNLDAQNLSGLNLKNSNLREASLIGANLTGSDLRGSVLIKAKLCRSKLVNTDLRGANLSSANLSSANLNYAKLSNRTYRVPEQINLEKCKRCRDYVRTKAYGANFSNARLDDAEIEGLGTEFEDSEEPKVLGPWLESSNFRNATLRRTNLKKSDLSNADFSRAILSGISGAELYDFSLFGNVGANLEEAILQGIDFNGTNLRGANLFKSIPNLNELRNADLRRAILPSGSLNTDLDNRNLGEADLVEIRDNFAPLSQNNDLPLEISVSC